MQSICSKLTIPELGGLVVTSHRGGERTTAVNLVRALALILQYSGNSIAHCDTILGNANLAEGHASTPCVVAAALKAQLLGSIGYPQDLALVQGVATADLVDEARSTTADSDLPPIGMCVYEPWEVRHVRAVLAFCKSRDFDGALALALDAVQREPRDVFSLRLIFICGFFSGRWGALMDALLHILTRTYLSDNLSTVQWTEATFDELDEWLCAVHESVLRRLRGGATGGRQAGDSAGGRQYLVPPDALVDDLIERSIHVPCFATLPYLLTYLAFALQEVLVDAIAVKPKDWGEESRQTSFLTNEAPRERLFGFVERWNRIALDLIACLNEAAVAAGSAEPPLTHPYAVHTIAHIFETRCQPAAGLRAVLSDVPGTLWRNSEHLLPHNWWHVALFHLDCGHVQEALAVLDEHVLPSVVKEDPFGISDATALLTRMLGLQGISVQDDRFRLVDNLWSYHYAEPTREATLTSLPFFHAHAMLSRWVLHEPLQVSSDYVSPVCRLLLDCLRCMHPNRHASTTRVDIMPHHETELSNAVRSLVAARHRWHLFGGSAAQRDLLLRLLVFVVDAVLGVSSDSALAKLVASLISPEARARHPYYAVMHHKLDQLPSN